MAALWAPAVMLDLNTASGQAFHEAIDELKEWGEQNPPGELPVTTGWNLITPEISEDLLKRNQQNRKPSLTTVKKYYQMMAAGLWKKTGQAILINESGKLEDAQQRLYASYFGNVSFPSYVVADVPNEPDLFAYIDNVKARTLADGIYTSGGNGLSGQVAAAVKLAWRYDNNAFGIVDQPKIRDITVIEGIEYTRLHPDLHIAAQRVVTTYSRALAMIKDKGVATFFLWKALAYYPEDKVEDFMFALGSGVNLDEDSPISGLRKRLVNADSLAKEVLRAPRRLALVIKAFLMFLNDEKISPKKSKKTIDKWTISVEDNDEFPRLEPQASAVV